MKEYVASKLKHRVDQLFHNHHWAQDLARVGLREPLVQGAVLRAPYPDESVCTRLLQMHQQMQLDFQGIGEKSIHTLDQLGERDLL